ncbi:hypothetical protein AFCDBAGC_3602 [Methylobacterium cerastii]|uniref:DMT family transporter n=1 Tax=Methylobacterium cerastii TaxID=932741 RepID=A0ABQ4QLD4_9HYPH|nr:MULTISPECIES: DMT family transporter [Methylobacterium]TXM91010.1 DMT family transporter [Methylobacterium sp. WL122]TXN78025.1 DMT family transporter [Methylobacterium sp. WL8]GJD45725.1 hypothetical protein AFCDBAGC_3602 [Methylobacterium cerastii]
MPDALLMLSAMAAGAAVVVQQGLNAQLRALLGSAAWSGAVSYAVGLAGMVLLAASLRDPLPSPAVLARIPWWAWSGGAFGAVFVGLAIVLVPRLGAAPFIGSLIAGQMLAAVAIDQFGWLGLAQRPLDGSRALGLILMVGAVMLI